MTLSFLNLMTDKQIDRRLKQVVCFFPVKNLNMGVLKLVTNATNRWCTL